MKPEPIILYGAALISIMSLLFIPKNKWFQAQFIFLLIQFPTWVLGLCAVELHLLEYPYREIGKVNHTSFIFEYLVLPVICMHFNARFPPNATKKKKLGIYVITCSVFTVFEALLERYTDLIEYTGWNWYITFVSVMFILWLSRITASWFFSEKQ